MSTINTKVHFDQPVVAVRVKKESTGHEFEWYVVESFFTDNKLAQGTVLSHLDAITKYNIISYTHKTTGPALKNLATKKETYWLRGLPADQAEVERLKYNSDFADQIDKLIKEE